MNDINIDFIGKGATQGQVAGYMAAQGRMDPGNLKPFIDDHGRVCITVYAGGDPTKKESYRDKVVNATPNDIQVNSTLRPYEWRQLDEVVQQISRTRLVGIQDLIDNNLVYNLGNAMGTTVLEYHDISDAMEADMTMDGVSRSRGDRPDFGPKYLPIPFIHSDYEINARVLAASRTLGNPLDTTMAELAARKVAEKLESLLFTDTTYAFGGGTIYSYLNHPNRNLATLTAHWNDSAASGATMLADVLNMIQTSVNDNHYGPWMLYVPTAYQTVLGEDYTTGYPKAVQARLLEIEGLKGIKVIDTLPADNLVLVQMTQDVVRLVRGMGIQSVQWDTEGKFVSKFKTLTIQVPQIRADQDGKSGIVHATL